MPLFGMFRGRKVRMDETDVDALLARLVEPMPGSWASDWRVGDIVKLTRPTVLGDLPAGTRGRIVEIEAVGRHVRMCRPIGVRFMGTHERRWCHPNDLKLVRHSDGLSVAASLEEMSRS